MIEKKLSNATPLDDENIVLRRSDKKEIANVSLSNLNEVGEKHFLNKTQITNCLLEVPQRVKVELDNGALTLEAGSVVIVPYGTSAPTMEIGETLNEGEIVDISWDGEKLFYYVKYDSDMSIYNLYSSDRTVFAGTNNNIVDMPTTMTFSQDSAPTIPTGVGGYALWYDTASNIVKYTNNKGSSWMEYLSLPFAVVGPYYGYIKSVFNGFGFIGSAIWCDKGVKGLIPNGRNTDGSLHNIIVETETLLIDNYEFSTTSELLYAQLFKHPNEDSLPTIGFNSLKSMNYDKQINLNLHDFGNDDIRAIYCINLFSFTTNTNGINNVIDFRHAFNALDYNNTEFIAHQAMPSSNYINLSLPASEGTLVAPADGYVVINADSTTTTSYISLNILTPSLSTVILQDLKMLTVTGRIIATSLPVAKGEIIQVGYYGISLNRFRFIYANGSL